VIASEIDETHFRRIVVRPVWRSVIVAFLPLCAVATASAGAVPRDFTLHAHFWPGGMPDYSALHSGRKNPEPWDLRFRASGKGRRDVFVTVLRHDMLDSKRQRSSVQLSSPRVAAVVEALRRSDFFTLPAVVPAEPFLEHARVLSLSVQMDGRRHAVQFYCEPSHGSATERAQAGLADVISSVTVTQ
jgi:hypothetical protein